MNASNQVDLPRSAGNVIPAHHVQLIRPTLQNPVTNARPHLMKTDTVSCAAEPRVTVVKDGDTVRAIEIVCTCGEVIRIECAY